MSRRLCGVEKTVIRRKYLAARRALSPDEWAARSRAVHDQLAEVDEFREATTVLTYVSPKDNEVDTQALIESMLTQGVCVLVPIAEKDRQLTWSRLKALSELGPGRFGILEPLPEFVRPMDPPDDAVVLVPGIAFTRDGYRIGYGGGYFDRFLAGFRGVSIGLAFDLQTIRQGDERKKGTVPSRPPTADSVGTVSFFQPHDVPVDIVVTESATYRRK